MENETQIKLPLGAIINEQRVVDVILRRMNAGDRLEMTRSDSARKPFDTQSNLIRRCIIRLGDDIPPTPAIIEHLSIGDRDYLLLELRKISLGTQVNMRFKCPGCFENLTVPINLDELKIRQLDLEHFEIFKGEPYLKIEDKEAGFFVNIRVPNAEDQKAIFSIAQRNALEGDYALYARCMRQWKDLEGPFDMNFIMNMGIDEIEWLEMVFTRAMPGPDWIHVVECRVCGTEGLMDLGKTDFLFKSRA